MTRHLVLRIVMRRRRGRRVAVSQRPQRGFVVVVVRGNGRLLQERGQAGM